MSYAEDRRWSDRFIPTIKIIVGPYLLAEAPLQVDRKQAADLILLQASGMMIACRVRKAKYRQWYARQFTIRSQRDSGARTELEKIRDGFGDWMFYGFAIDDDDPSQIEPWYLIDLKAFRSHWIRQRQPAVFGERSPNGIRAHKINNHDGTHGVAFEIDSFVGDPPLLIGSSDRMPNHAAR